MQRQIPTNPGYTSVVSCFIAFSLSEIHTPNITPVEHVGDTFHMELGRVTFKYVPFLATKLEINIPSLQQSQVG